MKYQPIINVERDPDDPNRINAVRDEMARRTKYMAGESMMTWRDGVNYWRTWARSTDGSVIDDAPRIAAFYEAMVDCNKASPFQLDDPMPGEIVQRLGMDR